MTGAPRDRTPGPWTYLEDPDTHAFMVVTDDENLDNVLAFDAFDDAAELRVEAEGNAKLMAAAPELLAMVKRLADTLHAEYEPVSDPAEVVEARALIAKIEGTA
jgi:hypothetical protein